MPRRHRIDSLEALRDEMADVFHKVRVGRIGRDKGRLLAFIGQTLTGVLRSIEEVKFAQSQRGVGSDVSGVIEALEASAKGIWEEGEGDNPNAPGTKAGRAEDDEEGEGEEGESSGPLMLPLPHGV